MKKNPLPSYKHSPKPNGEAKLAAIYVACLTGLLSLIGLVLVSSASLGEGYNEFGNAFYFARQQATWWVVGWLGFAFGRYVPLRWWRKGALSAFLLSIVLMIAVFVPGVGKMVNGAHRWVDLGFLSFQPVEALKLSLVLYFADWMSRHRRMQTFLFLVALMAGLLLLQPDLGSALIVIGVATTMYFSAGARWRDIGAFFTGRHCMRVITNCGVTISVSTVTNTYQPITRSVWFGVSHSAGAARISSWRMARSRLRHVATKVCLRP
jgi:cell division protein FtsW